MNTAGPDILRWIEENSTQFTRMSDQIWEYAELPWREFKSSLLQADYLQSQGFEITWDLAGINTAFMSHWGKGNPLIGFAGEYDALEGLSQKKQPVQEPLTPGAPGHGCGHNLLGVGCLAAAAAIKNWLENSAAPGSVRYYGCPAEEGGSAKAYMARAGVFDDLDAAFNFHPASINMPSKSTCVGVNHIRFRFHGIASHAGEEPHLGRSALDAVELMNIGVNYLREHVPKYVRLHYAITHGGDVPNIVPPEAEVWYYIRALHPQELCDVTERVRDIARGAALMTGTTCEEIFESASSAILNNHALADLQFEAMQQIGPIQYTPKEMAYAQTISDAFPKQNVDDFFNYVESLEIPVRYRALIEKYRQKPLIGENFPALDADVVETGSTDVGDLSRVAPLSMLNTACWVIAAPGHSWGNVATGAMSIGHKGMLHAARIMALAASELYTSPERLALVRAEFEQVTQGKPYQCPIPMNVQPPQFPNPLRSG